MLLDQYVPELKLAPAVLTASGGCQLPQQQVCLADSQHLLQDKQALPSKHIGIVLASGQSQHGMRVRNRQGPVAQGSSTTNGRLTKTDGVAAAARARPWHERQLYTQTLETKPHKLHYALQNLTKSAAQQLQSGPSSRPHTPFCMLCCPVLSHAANSCAQLAGPGRVQEVISRSSS